MFVMEIVCKSSLPPGGIVVRQLKNAAGPAKTGEAEWSYDGPVISRAGTYLVRCFMAERDMKTKAGEPLKPLRNLRLVRTIFLNVASLQHDAATD
jgi:hypothetical protein